jgi:DNA-binding transcriptional MerR regulator
MSDAVIPYEPIPPPDAVPDLFKPTADTLYSLYAAAQLAGVPCRTLLMYCRVGLIRPSFQAPYGMMEFTEEAIHTVRRYEQVRLEHHVDWTLLKTIVELVDEVEHLRAEVRFLRSR